MPSDTTPKITWLAEDETRGIDIVDGTAVSDTAVPSTTLFLFLDESGNFDFSSSGTRYFIMTCVATRRPFVACHDLMDIKYDFFEKGLTMKKFHATDDNRDVRTAVYDIIERHASRFTAYSIYVDKSQLPDELKSAHALYAKIFELLTDEVLQRESAVGTDKIIVITDDIPKEAKKKEVAKPLKRLLKSFSERTGIPSCLEHFPSESDFNLQVADYLCWAFMRYAMRGDEWPYNKVSGIFSETGWILPEV